MEAKFSPPLEQSQRRSLGATEPLGPWATTGGATGMDGCSGVGRDMELMYVMV